MRIFVRKKNGRLQPFNLLKVMRTIEAAGAGVKLLQEISWDVVREILSDIRQGVKTFVIPSGMIRKLVVRGLSRKSPSLAKKYARYEND
ncbi:MAG: ATP cone domain-containing protein [Candidatus Micrarchaeota archaeon]|nr:ATP cone domain-containing protein [Candidatus Micrarchaeota archaeon]